MANPREKKLAVLSALMLMMTSTLANADDAQPVKYDPEFKSSQYLYENCKQALNAENFGEGYCAAYIEGYIGGSSVSGLYMLGQASNQREIIDRADQSKCDNLAKDAPRGQRVRWTAEFFVNWIEKNQEIIASENAFLDREAFTILHTISTDERFCELSSANGNPD